MVKKKTPEVNYLEVIKPLALKSEETINNVIHKLLKDPQVIDLIKLGSKQHYQFIKLAREYADVISTQLNIPTKTDVANVAQLVKQLEEKIESLEEKLLTKEKERQTTDSKKVVERSREEDKIKKDELKRILSNMHKTSTDNSLLTKQLLERLLDRRRKK
ncbi:hypothetical protein [Alkalihalobacterium elongatum]|uniref:hypothetical protein n=1 Tax=Alkalihalobacterium elongatum TaxID=2675466 RepID=UPI001C1FE1AA|nr:hypothetical protein [Alkalihalobacterium elongatum]